VEDAPACERGGVESNQAWRRVGGPRRAARRPVPFPRLRPGASAPARRDASGQRRGPGPQWAHSCACASAASAPIASAATARALIECELARPGGVRAAGAAAGSGWPWHFLSGWGWWNVIGLREFARLTSLRGALRRQDGQQYKVFRSLSRRSAASRLFWDRNGSHYDVVFSTQASRSVPGCRRPPQGH
jgi:hypothetical protein